VVSSTSPAAFVAAGALAYGARRKQNWSDNFVSAMYSLIR
jgi:hypothetical protein